MYSRPKFWGYTRTRQNSPSLRWGYWDSTYLHEVELNGGTLPVTVQTIDDGDVDLGSIEGAISRVQGPGSASTGSEFIETLSQNLG